MSILSLSQQQQLLIVEELRSRCDAHTIIIFGSVAKGTMRPESDIDIAYLSSIRRSTYQRFRIGQQVADLLERDVDLIDFQEASTVFQIQIATTGIVLYEENPLLRQLSYMQAFREYVQLNDKRQYLLDHFIEKRGTL
ncbi:nucleotidyltransferase domain-containing protein [Paenibacillus sp. KACC 21273]|uniref:type VII toxin-antitoxin system MntA family adenylyltransferase antitoxin n=1 Tax=Paenibacillus sp. KACC 21273 TaxID=3025665 RepID=UPI002366A924|nr:nucleotidyltransferase domain-containing protein [Paenibacillus sp. KACC 21273]WDF49641.1 nucleotidyltransferase domain-containing protein [Paenibacillus sp. KACC 21273]